MFGWSKHLSAPGPVVLLILFSSITVQTVRAGTPRPQANSARRTDLKDFDKFLDDHPSIVPDLKRDPPWAPERPTPGLGS